MHTAGSWEQGTVVTVQMDQPGPLISLLVTLPSIEAKPLLSGGPSGLLKSAMGSLGERGRRRQRVSVAFKDAQSDEKSEDTPVQEETNSPESSDTETS